MKPEIQGLWNFIEMMKYTEEEKVAMKLDSFADGWNEALEFTEQYIVSRLERPF